MYLNLINYMYFNPNSGKTAVKDGPAGTKVPNYQMTIIYGFSCGYLLNLVSHDKIQAIVLLMHEKHFFNLENKCFLFHFKKIYASN